MCKGQCCFLTVVRSASWGELVVLQAMRLNAVVAISFVHERHSDSVPFLCPQDWTWTNVQHCHRGN